MWRRSFLISVASLSAVGAFAAPPPHEQSRIEKLIHFIETRKDMTFIRNGTEYTCTDAAKFLRGKMESMGGEVTNARDFIERIASKSSMSGKPYQVKFADGKLMMASQFLSDELKRMEGQPA